MDRNRFFMLIGDLGILIVALIWGTANVVIRDALDGITPLWFCGLRFAIAWVTVMIFFGKKAFLLPKETRLKSTLLGMVFICAYLCGAIGLVYTTAGNQSFIISMSVVLVPLSVWILTKTFPGWHVVFSVILCTMGMCGLMLDGNFTVNLGDLLSFGSCIFVTVYILLVQKYVKGVDPYALTCWQAFGGMLLAVSVAVTFEPFPTNIPLKAWLAIIHTGTIGFALTLVIQTVAQKYTNATHVAILLSTSGVFGSIAGIIFIDEPMTFRIFIASAMILAGVITVEAVPALRKRHVDMVTKNEQLI
ncbi:MAG: DMT family transporter [Synergistaceae bacterium]|nr:DMT family transporter [Synergistaceae bacterium]